jgi:hypothetical protein
MTDDEVAVILRRLANGIGKDNPKPEPREWEIAVHKQNNRPYPLDWLRYDSTNSWERVRVREVLE